MRPEGRALCGEDGTGPGVNVQQHATSRRLCFPVRTGTRAAGPVTGFCVPLRLHKSAAPESAYTIVPGKTDGSSSREGVTFCSVTSDALLSFYQKYR